MDFVSALGGQDWPVLFLSFAILGAVSGFIAGLLGVGGGIVLVPGFYILFGFLGYAPETLMHLFVGTSLAAIIPTGLASARAHMKREAVDFKLVREIGIGIVFGVVAGAWLAGYLSGSTLKMIFATALIGLALLMFVNPAKFSLRDRMPSQPWIGTTGFFIGGLSTLVGVGGGSMNVPFMVLCHVPVLRAIGTAAALGVVIAIPATLGFVIIGWNASGLPPYSLGYVSLPVLFLIVPISIVFAKLGVKAAHALPVKSLRKVFAVFLLIVAAQLWLEGA